MEKIKNFWLVKFAPFRTSWDEIVKRGIFTMRGVRSPLARKNLSQMKIGDIVLFYHSQTQKAIVGVMEVARESYPDPTSADPKWLTCDFRPLKSLPYPVTLLEIRKNEKLRNIPLVRQPKLSVMRISGDEFKKIINDTLGND
ncbi:MAG: EVE domain-containing protein [Victivallales bacterium]